MSLLLATRLLRAPYESSIGAPPEVGVANAKVATTYKYNHTTHRRGAHVDEVVG